MKKGDNINGYVVLNDIELSGLSTWSFAMKDKKIYFIKEFLSPVFPNKDAPGSIAVKQKKIKACQEFEAIQDELIKTVNPSVSEGGNLIFTKDFFRHGTKYYKITDKIDVASISLDDISKLSIEKRILILKTAAHSLNTLHHRKITHGDLKPDNILITITETGDYTSKLIDFDSSYFSGRPPLDRQIVVGTPLYYSPELEKYIKGDVTVKPEDLTLKSDVFALGIIFCQYLTNKFPEGISHGGYASTAVNNGVILKIIETKELPAKLIKVINSMLQLDCSARPTINEVFHELKNIDKPDIVEPAPPLFTGKLKINMKVKSEKDTPATNLYTGKLKINMKVKKEESTSLKEEEPKPSTASKLKINFKTK